MIMGAVAFTGCAPSGTDTPDRGAAASATSEELPFEAPPEKDVKITSCSVDKLTGRPVAELEISNHGEREATYMLAVEFVSADGTSLGAGTTMKSALAAGHRGLATARGRTPASGKPVCRMVDVSRYPAKPKSSGSPSASG
ncbi:hypothetical protein A6A06_17735 [Streptomyces sp. CB02923]|nr:hypothetical protein A6A06_17735 [Streptomyces sp. CB02923]